MNHRVETDYLIIGQGIAGTMLSWCLLRAGRSVIVLDDARPNTASRVAAGIINPVSGRRFEPAWLYDTIYPFARDSYTALGHLLQEDVFTERDIWNVFPSAQLRDAFMAKTATGISQQYTRLPSTELFQSQLQQPFGAAVIKGATVNLRALLPAYRSWLEAQGALVTGCFDPEALEISASGVRYGEITAGKVIFCNGIGLSALPWFKNVPFLPNKGEVLLVRIPGLNTSHIIKKSITLVPYGPELYWAGSSFVWDYPDELPTTEKRAQLEKNLEQLLLVPYEVTGQLAAVRPSGKDRRPVIGLHPQLPALGVFNALGTKGTSLAPFMADHFTRHLLEAAPLMPEVDLRRFY